MVEIKTVLFVAVAFKNRTQHGFANGEQINIRQLNSNVSIIQYFISEFFDRNRVSPLRRRMETIRRLTRCSNTQSIEERCTPGSETNHIFTQSQGRLGWATDQL